MQPLVGLSFQREAREADFRYGLVRVRDNAEAIAVYDGARSEARLLLTRLRAAVRTHTRLLTATRNLSLFSTTYDTVLEYLPTLVLAPRFFAGTAGLGLLVHGEVAFDRVQACLSLVVDESEKLAALAAVVARLREFDESLERRSTLPPSETPAVPEGSLIERKDVSGATLP